MTAVLTIKDVARKYKVSERTVFDWYHRRGLPYFKLGKGDVRFWEEDVEVFMMEHTKCHLHPEGCASCPIIQACPYRSREAS